MENRTAHEHTLETVRLLEKRKEAKRKAQFDLKSLKIEAAIRAAKKRNNTKC